MDLMDYRRKIIANSPHLASASGAVATFSDGADLPLKSLIVDIEPVQSGSGDPSPSNIRPISGWDAVNVAIVGKNLWHPVSNYPTTGNGITYSLNADGSIHVQGTASGQSNNYPIASNGMSIEAGTYTMSVRTTDPNIHFIFGGGNGTAGIAYTDMVNGSKKTFTTNGGTTGHNIVRINSGVTVNGDIYIQLEKGSVATLYEPYTNIKVQLGRTVYGGTLNVLTGVLTVDSQIITGNANWGTYWNSHKAEQVDTNKRATFSLSLTNETVYAQKASAKCNMLIHDTVILNGFGDKNAFCLHPTLGRCLYICLPLDTLGMSSATSATSDDDFKNAIKAMGDNLQIVIPLATPYEIQLTPHQIRSLYGNNIIFADTGNVALEYWAHA